MKARALIASGLALAIASSAFAQSAVFDQKTIPFSNVAGNSELLMQSYSVSGGTIYVTVLKQAGMDGKEIGLTQTFVPTAAGGSTRYLPLVHGHTDAGATMTASAGAGVFGISRTAGSSLALTTEVANNNTKTDNVIWEFNLPDSYKAGSNIAVTVNGVISGASCSLTGGSTLLTVTPYTEVNGVETAVTVSAAQQWGKTAAAYTFTITGTGLVPGQHMTLELAAAVAAANSNNCTGSITNVSYGA